MTLFTQEIGSASHPSIVFLHGGGAGAWMWQEIIADLRRDYHCLAPDLPEHGGSQQSGAFQIAHCAALVAALIKEKANGGQAHLVGLSLGAQVTVALLASTPQRLLSAVVSSALLHPLAGARMYTPKLLKLTYWTAIEPFKKANWWIDLNSKYAAGIPERYYPNARRDFQHMTESSWVHILTENINFRLPAGLERALTPTLALAGQGEYAAMRASVRDLTDALPNGHGYLVAHGKRPLAEQHNWPLANPELFIRTLRAWLEKSPLPEELRRLEQ